MSQSQLIQGLPLIYPANTNLVASTTLIVWDTFLVFDEEAKFIWSSKHTFVKILYLTVRYLVPLVYCGMIIAFLGSPTHFSKFCPEIMWIVSLGGLSAITCSNLLLIQRVYAFYGRSKPVLWSLVLLLGLTETLTIVIMAVGVPGYRVIVTKGDHLPPPFGACIVAQYPGKLSFVFFSELIFQSIAFLFVVGRFANLQFWAWKTRVPYSPLYINFFRDGTWVFTILFFTFLLSGVYMHTSTGTGLSFALWSYVFSSICCSRLILNLKQTAKRDRNYTSTA